ncbi:hypothetical protein AMAG_03235 [Allomyces macrogynus ATCC 38327]|uniref:Uncharacterized protein n=1 Tax=Allomyces macrogynus (strain ATCC 38327) TaxID=578462 RepID=A0A0L0S4T4_ALLM3|nr:hypothetical protein AMAG_03235 [Allomyces macrogynus ATCC 38327]|eukprot:KNE57533.1 hypothetical protein AMAG_03235 [Allomyces macrogynus ATCC 38327]
MSAPATVASSAATAPDTGGSSSSSPSSLSPAALTVAIVVPLLAVALALFGCFVYRERRRLDRLAHRGAEHRVRQETLARDRDRAATLARTMGDGPSPPPPNGGGKSGILPGLVHPHAAVSPHAVQLDTPLAPTPATFAFASVDSMPSPGPARPHLPSMAGVASSSASASGTSGSMHHGRKLKHAARRVMNLLPRSGSGLAAITGGGSSARAGTASPPNGLPDGEGDDDDGVHPNGKRGTVESIQSVQWVAALPPPSFEPGSPTAASPRSTNGATTAPATHSAVLAVRNLAWDDDDDMSSEVSGYSSVMSYSSYAGAPRFSSRARSGSLLAMHSVAAESNARSTVSSMTTIVTGVSALPPPPAPRPGERPPSWLASVTSAAHVPAPSPPLFDAPVSAPASVRATSPPPIPLGFAMTNLLTTPLAARGAGARASWRSSVSSVVPPAPSPLGPGAAAAADRRRPMVASPTRTHAASAPTSHRTSAIWSDAATEGSEDGEEDDPQRVAKIEHDRHSVFISDGVHPWPPPPPPPSSHHLSPVEEMDDLQEVVAVAAEGTVVRRPASATLGAFMDGVDLEVEARARAEPPPPAYSQ